MANLLKKNQIQNGAGHENREEPHALAESQINNEEIINQAFQEGYRQALLEQEELRKSWQNGIEKLNQLTQNIRTALESQKNIPYNDIADIILTICNQYFIEQKQKKEAIIAQIQQIVRCIHQQQTIKIFLHPADIYWLQQHQNALGLLNHKDITVSADHALALGGCRIATEHGLFDASIERRINQLKCQLEKMQAGELL